MLEPQSVKNYEVPNIEELVDEAVLLVLAGTDTTTYATTNATLFILTHSDVLKRLQDELQHTLRGNGDQLEWASIRQLPYLVRCSSSRCGRYFFLEPFPFLLAKQSRLPSSKRHCACLPLFLGQSLVKFRLKEQSGSHFLPGGLSCKDRLCDCDCYPADASFQTILSVSQHLIHQNPRNFPEPATFNSDRCLGEEGKNLRKWNVAFSSGTRSCIGIQ